MLNFVTDNRGYERWVENESLNSVAVHQLIAIAEGADPHKVFSHRENQIHHKNGVEWDNRPSNISFINASEHGSIHANERLNREMDRPWTNKELMKKEYWKNGLDRKELAEKWGTNDRTIRRWLKKHKLRWDLR